MSEFQLSVEHLERLPEYSSAEYSEAVRFLFKPEQEPENIIPFEYDLSSRLLDINENQELIVDVVAEVSRAIAPLIMEAVLGSDYRNDNTNHPIVKENNTGHSMRPLEEREAIQRGDKIVVEGTLINLSDESENSNVTPIEYGVKYKQDKKRRNKPIRSNQPSFIDVTQWDDDINYKKIDIRQPIVEVIPNIEPLTENSSSIISRWKRYKGLVNKLNFLTDVELLDIPKALNTSRPNNIKSSTIQRTPREIADSYLIAEMDKLSPAERFTHKEYERYEAIVSQRRVFSKTKHNETISKKHEIHNPINKLNLERAGNLMGRVAVATLGLLIFTNSFAGSNSKPSSDYKIASTGNMTEYNPESYTFSVYDPAQR